MSRWRWAPLALADGAGRPRADRVASSGMPPCRKKQLSEAVWRRALAGEAAVIIGRTQQMQALTALDDAGTVAVRLSRGDVVADR